VRGGSSVFVIVRVGTSAPPGSDLLRFAYVFARGESPDLGLPFVGAAPRASCRPASALRCTESRNPVGFHALLFTDLPPARGRL
jgi:hypothetical protein